MKHITVIGVAALLVPAGCALFEPVSGPAGGSIGVWGVPPSRPVREEPDAERVRRLVAGFRAVYPLTAASAGKESRRVVSVPPFFSYEREGDSYSWYALGGLFSRAEDPEEGYRRLGLPFYSRVEQPGELFWTLFPLMLWHRKDVEGGMERRFDILGMLYRDYRRPGYFEKDVLFPVFQVARGEQDGLDVFRLRLLPLFSYERKWEPGGGGTGMRYERSANILWPLFSYYRDNYGPGYQRVDVLWPVFRFTRGCPDTPCEREVTFFMFPLTGWGKYWIRDEMGNLVDYRTEFHLADPVLSWVRSTREGLRFRLLGPVLSYRSTPGGNRDLRILVKTIRAARIGDKRIFNIWPFFGNEWNPVTNERKTIILGGLFYYRRDADGNTVKRILWFIPIGRRTQPQEEEPAEPEPAGGEAGGAGPAADGAGAPADAPAEAAAPSVG